MPCCVCPPGVPTPAGTAWDAPVPGARPGWGAAAGILAVCQEMDKPSPPQWARQRGAPKAW